MTKWCKYPINLPGNKTMNRGYPMSMTVKDVFTTINSAHQIKKQPGVYSVYSKHNAVFIYCDESGLPKHFIYQINGFQHPLTDAESRIIRMLVTGRYAQLCQDVQRTVMTARIK